MCCQRFRSFVFILLSYPLFSCKLVYAENLPDSITVSNEVHQLLKINAEALQSERVAKVVETIKANREHYPNEVVAKAFLLATRAASNQGDVNNVYAYAKEGLSIYHLDKTVKVSLSLKLAEAYVAKKEYQQLLSLVQPLVEESHKLVNEKYYLLALSYRSVAFSMLELHFDALKDLQAVEQRVNQIELSERLPLLTIFALAYHHLSDYQTSLAIQLEIKKLRLELNLLHNIDQTYLYLGYAYFYLQRFDDAYNAFWESKRAATLKGAPINTAYANKGLGIVLLTQQKPQEALEHLQHSVLLFSSQKMISESIETSAALAKALLSTGHKEQAYIVLSESIVALNEQDISPDFSGFNRMVADMYFDQKQYTLAYQWRIKDSEVLLQKIDKHKQSFTLLNNLYRPEKFENKEEKPLVQSKNLAVKLAENSQLSSRFIEKFENQQFMISILLITVFSLLALLMVIFLKMRSNKISSAFESIEKPSYYLNTPSQTKYYYQVSYNKARQYNYPLCVGYIVITNWQELTFRFNKKTINEVSKTLAGMINEHIGEFDFAGLLNHGEYLLLFDHQTCQQASEKITKLAQAINTRSFANLGNINIVTKFAINCPDFKDIDPYLFLARITEPVKVETINQQNVSK